MPAERTLPISAEHREFTVKVNGEAVPREAALAGLSIVAAANRVASARLHYVDGDAASGGFPLASGDLFVPGAEVEILAGSRRDATPVFKGIVVRQRLRVREAASPLLVVDCRHAATRLTLLRRSANFFDQTDSDAIQSLLDAAGLDAEVEATTVPHAQLVQHDCSDWDFVLARAAANGLVVHTRVGTLALRKPALGEPAAELAYGATVLAFDGEIDARQQSQQVQVASWSAAEQALHTEDGEAGNFDPPGNFTADDLAGAAGAEARVLHHAALPDAEAAALASAHWQRAVADLAGGRLECHGIATVLPGDTVRLAGLGERFNGDALVSGVRHEFDTSKGWKTHIQFGGLAEDAELRNRLQAHRTAALLAPVAGLQAGVVTDNEDPEGEFRVRVRLPLVNDGDEGVWARVATLDAGAERGSFFRPEIDDEVLVGFLDDDPRAPVILGMLHSSAKAAPLAPSNDNHQKGYTSRSGIQLLFDDDKKSLTLATPGGNKLLLDDDGRGITIEDQHGNRIVTSSSGITIESATALTLKAGTAMKIEGTASTDVKSGGVVKVAGASLQLG